MPRLFLIQDGKIELVQDGFYKVNEENLEDALKSALEEES